MVYPNSSSSLYFLQSDGLQVKSESGFTALYESVFFVLCSILILGGADISFFSLSLMLAAANVAYIY